MNPMGMMAINFLPILVFIIVDSLFQNLILSLGIALICALIEGGVIYFKTKTIDLFILFDIFLLGLFSGFSLISGNDLFFKLKPGLMGLGFSFFLIPFLFKPEWLKGWLNRYLRGVIPMTSHLEEISKKLFLYLIILLIFHSVLAIYAALYLSRGWWVFISGPFLFLLFGFLGIFLFIQGRQSLALLPIKGLDLRLYLFKDNYLILKKEVDPQIFQNRVPLTDEEAELLKGGARELQNNLVNLIPPWVEELQSKTFSLLGTFEMNPSFTYFYNPMDHHLILLFSGYCLDPYKKPGITLMKFPNEVPEVIFQPKTIKKFLETQLKT